MLLTTRVMIKAIKKLAVDGRRHFRVKLPFYPTWKALYMKVRHKSKTLRKSVSGYIWTHTF